MKIYYFLVLAVCFLSSCSNHIFYPENPRLGSQECDELVDQVEIKKCKQASNAAFEHDKLIRDEGIRRRGE
jgi:hypothetical protein